MDQFLQSLVDRGLVGMSKFNTIEWSAIRFSLDPVVQYRVYHFQHGEETPAMQTLTIGKVARQAGVGVETVRFYEREGLITEPMRSGSGYRQYPEEAVSRIRFIRRAKELGFALREVRELLSLRVAPDTSTTEVKAHAQAKMADIEQKIRMLRRMKKTLEDLTDACDGCGPVGDCPILGALEAHEIHQD